MPEIKDADLSGMCQHAVTGTTTARFTTVSVDRLAEALQAEKDLVAERARAEAAEAENAALRAAAQYVAVSCLHVEGWCKGCDAVRDILSRPVGERARAALDGAGAETAE